jgi:hypothetical protein
MSRRFFEQDTIEMKADTNLVGSFNDATQFSHAGVLLKAVCSPDIERILQKPPLILQDPVNPIN